MSATPKTKGVSYDFTMDFRYCNTHILKIKKMWNNFSYNNNIALYYDISSFT